jgi:hypothetical protein
MDNIVTWQGCLVDVQAGLVARYLWHTASIDVTLDGRPILQTGGQLKVNGSHSTTFVHAGSTHTVQLSWGISVLGISFPYQLRIDGVPLVASRVKVRNWQITLIVMTVEKMALMIGVFYLVYYCERFIVR